MSRAGTSSVREENSSVNIFGGVKVDGNWRSSIQEERVPLKLLNTNPNGKRRSGRPKTRWKDEVESDLRSLKVTDILVVEERRISLSNFALLVKYQIIILLLLNKQICCDLQLMVLDVCR